MRINHKHRSKFLKLRYRDFLKEDSDSIDNIIKLFYKCLSAKYNITSAGFMFDCSRGKYHIITDFTQYDKRVDKVRFNIDIARKCCTINKTDLLALKQYQFNPEIKDEIIETSKVINSIILKENAKYKYYHQYLNKEEYSQIGFYGRRYYAIQTKQIKGLRFKKDKDGRKI